MEELQNISLDWDKILNGALDFLQNGVGSVVTSTVSVASTIVMNKKIRMNRIKSNDKTIPTGLFNFSALFPLQFFSRRFSPPFKGIFITKAIAPPHIKIA